MSERPEWVTDQGETLRGFDRIDFRDINNDPCSVQQSSAIIDNVDRPGEGALWLGEGENRMHLDRARVAWLIGVLAHWLAEGMLP